MMSKKKQKKKDKKKTRFHGEEEPHHRGWAGRHFAVSAIKVFISGGFPLHSGGMWWGGGGALEGRKGNVEVGGGDRCLLQQTGPPLEGPCLHSDRRAEEYSGNILLGSRSADTH